MSGRGPRLYLKCTEANEPESSVQLRLYLAMSAAVCPPRHLTTLGRIGAVQLCEVTADHMYGSLRSRSCSSTGLHVLILGLQLVQYTLKSTSA